MNKTPESSYDVTVIGAGIGGLTSAVLLAKAGLKVCVVEQDTQPGGYLAGFSRKGFHFSTSVHWLNQCAPTGFVGRIFNFIDPDYPKAISKEKIRRFKGDDHDYALSNNPEELKQQLIQEFPHEEKGINQFFAAAKKIGQAFQRSAGLIRSIQTMNLIEKMGFGLRSLGFLLSMIRYLPYSSEKGLAKFFKEDKIKKMFISEPDLMSCLAPIGWAYVNDFQDPPASGSRAYPDWLVAYLKQLGSDIFFNCPAEKVHIQDNEVQGIQVSLKGELRDIQSRYVLSASDLETLYKYMLPSSKEGSRFLKNISKAELYGSGVTLYIGLDVNPKELGFTEENIFLTRDDVEKKDHGSGDPEKSALSVLCPSLNDPSLAPADKGTLVVFCHAEYEYEDYWKTEPGPDGTRIRGEAYKAFKKAYAETLIKRVEKALAPGLIEHIELMEVATPMTFQRYTGNRNGTMMGARPSPKNMRAGVAGYRTHIKNLYLSGHWAEYGGGMPTAVRAAANAALLVLKQENKDFYHALADITDGK